MCNLHRMTKAPAEVARWFGGQVGSIGKVGTEVYARQKFDAGVVIQVD